MDELYRHTEQEETLKSLLSVAEIESRVLLMMSVDEIKQTISINDVIYKYGLEPNSKGFMRCPFHDENTASFKVYPNTNSFYCFGCGENGDVIKFVQKIFNISFNDALLRLDDDFCLGLFNKPTLTQARKNKKQLQEIEARRNERQLQLEYNKYAYTKLIEYYRWIKTQPESKHKTHDIEFMDRLFEMYLDPNVVVKHNVDALIPALKTKLESEV